MTATASHAATPAAHRVGLRTLDDEVVLDELPVEGEVPAWLEGALLRNGPARFEAGERPLAHWFDGLAMVHRFAIRDGRVGYRNRFLRTRAYRAVEETGALGLREFATDPCRSLFGRVMSTFRPELTDNGAVSIHTLGEEALALTETPLPVRFDPGTLETAGVVGWAGEIPGVITTAHPGRTQDELVNVAIHLGPRSAYRAHAIAPGGRIRPIASVPATKPGYLHSFGMTERFLVLAEFPLVVDPKRLALSGRPYIENFRWEPERGTRITVVDLADGRVTARAQAPAMFAFHHVNAFEDGDALRVDLCRFDDASIVDALRLDALRGPAPRIPSARPSRLHVPLAGGDVRVETLADVDLELPRVAGRVTGRPYRYAYGISGLDDAPARGALAHGLVKVDVSAGTFRGWEADGCSAGEPVFVAAPGARDEDEGVLLSVVLDPAAERSFLLVLDAATMEERARAHVPHHVPLGFHGAFLRG